MLQRYNIYLINASKYANFYIPGAKIAALSLDDMGH